MEVFVLVLVAKFGSGSPLFLLPRTDTAVYKTAAQCEQVRVKSSDPDVQCLKYTILDPQ